jgi:hypothetical protein
MHVGGRAIASSACACHFQICTARTMKKEIAQMEKNFFNNSESAKS